MVMGSDAGAVAAGLCWELASAGVPGNRRARGRRVAPGQTVNRSAEPVKGESREGKRKCDAARSSRERVESELRVSRE